MGRLHGGQGTGGTKTPRLLPLGDKIYSLQLRLLPRTPEGSVMPARVGGREAARRPVPILIPWGSSEAFTYQPPGLAAYSISAPEVPAPPTCLPREEHLPEASRCCLRVLLWKWPLGNLSQETAFGKCCWDWDGRGAAPPGGHADTGFLRSENASQTLLPGAPVFSPSSCPPGLPPCFQTRPRSVPAPPCPPHA